MSFNERLNYQSFVDNRIYIENKRNKQWGDRINELVFISQDIEKEKMIAEIQKCLLLDNEQTQFESKTRFSDPFPKDI